MQVFNRPGNSDGVGGGYIYAKAGEGTKTGEDPRDETSHAVPERKLHRHRVVRIVVADGGVSGGANVFPHLYVHLYKYAAEGDQTRAGKLQKIVQQISSEIYSCSSYGPRVIQGIKASLACLGIGEGLMLEPLPALTEDERTHIGHHLAAVEMELLQLAADESMPVAPPLVAENRNSLTDV